MATFVLIFFVHVGAGTQPANLGVYTSEQRCQMAAIQAGALAGEAKPKFVCVQQ